MFRIRSRDKSISLLLGAGFSAPMGYPIGCQLNKSLLACIGDTFAFSPAVELVASTNGTKPNLGCKNPYDWYFDFCIDAIHYYNNNVKAFDYEEFYDYYKEQVKTKSDIRLQQLFNDGSYAKNDFENFDRYLSQMDNIYHQLVAFYLKDREGKSWYYEDPILSKPTVEGYIGVLNCIEYLLKDGYTINVHTLNHDLFFERLNNSEWLNGKLSDGFDEINSPFFGKLADETKCKLSRYTGIYNTKLRLYKLHGSKDYYCYYTHHRDDSNFLIPENYIKNKWGVKTTEFYKRIIDEAGNFKDENCAINYHSDFLTGTTSKIERYKEPLLYKNLFKLFKKNLNDAEKLIIIGYGCKDTEINRYILKEFGTKKPCLIINPFAEDAVRNFAKEIGKNAVLVNKQSDNLLISDIRI